MVYPKTLISQYDKRSTSVGLFYYLTNILKDSKVYLITHYIRDMNYTHKLKQLPPETRKEFVSTFYKVQDYLDSVAEHEDTSLTLEESNTFRSKLDRCNEALTEIEETVLDHLTFIHSTHQHDK